MTTLLATFIIGYLDEDSLVEQFPADGERITIEIGGKSEDLFDETTGHPDVDYITFIGEKKSGKILMLDTFREIDK